MFNWIQHLLGSSAAASIRAWVRITGKTIRKADAPWLDCPLGPAGRIGGTFYEDLAARTNLKIEKSDDAGLVQDFNELAGDGFDPQSVHPAVRDFYERTSRYKLEAWTEPSPLMKPFLWLLVKLVSRHMDQLNFPVNPLDTSRGMTSEVVPMIDQGTGQRKFTGWRRKLVALNRIIYTGLYQSETPPASNRPYVKVSFPLPLGSATVFLRPEAQPDGSLKLISDGSRMGESGFYRMVHNDETSWKVRFVHTLHEIIHVYVDEENVLRTDHSFSYLGLNVLKLHYKMQLKKLPSDSQDDAAIESRDKEAKLCGAGAVS